MKDIYVEKYKGIRLMLNVLSCALSGNYVNFGVFSLYQDPALQNSLDVSLQVCFIVKFIANFLLATTTAAAK